MWIISSVADRRLEVCEVSGSWPTDGIDLLSAALIIRGLELPDEGVGSRMHRAVLGGSPSKSEDEAVETSTAEGASKNEYPVAVRRFRSGMCNHMEHHGEAQNSSFLIGAVS